MKLIFATGNENKVREIRAMLPEGMEVLSLKDIGFHDEIPETTGTIEGNSLQKAQAIRDLSGEDCMAEDTGLEVRALGGEPGVDSAIYAGEAKDNVANMDLLLKNMLDKEDRYARFRTVVTLLHGEEVHQFEGILEGSISRQKKGEYGFGYDPIFTLDNGKTLAELTMEEKVLISHRGRAVRNLIKYLKNNYI